ncbi:uncharacterized protein [Acropora muricata]|uniref:uncharacterized protein n=1 Tax=Acropora muricata TaxID=159855 RepID=UPI0034E3B22E
MEHDVDLTNDVNYLYRGAKNIVAQRLLANTEEPVSPDSQKKVITACAKLDLRANHCDNDIDDCTTAIIKCHEQAICINYDGSYICECNSSNVGYRKTSCQLGFPGILVLRKQQVNTPSLQNQLHQSTWRATIPQAISRPVSNLACILDYTRPHVNAYLDAKLVMLLAARGVQVEYLKALQTDYYRLLKDMCNDSASKEYFLRLTGRAIEAVGRMKISRTSDEKKESEFKGEEKVFVVRTPCYHPGDIHVFKLCREKPLYKHLIDCLVPPHGHAIENARADLNRNQFIVCWDSKLIPKLKVNPCSYLPTTRERMNDTWDKCLSYFRRSPQKTAKELREELIDHFASFKDDLPSRIDQVYLKLARRDSGLALTECEQFSRMHYQATNYSVDKEYFQKRCSGGTNLKEIEDQEDEGNGKSRMNW